MSIVPGAPRPFRQSLGLSASVWQLWLKRTLRSGDAVLLPVDLMQTNGLQTMRWLLLLAVIVEDSAAHMAVSDE